MTTQRPLLRRTKTHKLLAAAERAPLNWRTSEGASRLRMHSLAKRGYLERRRIDGVELYFRTEKPYVRPADENHGTFDFAAHARRFREW